MTVVGEAFVAIRPDNSGFARELQSDVNTALGQVDPELDVGLKVSADTTEAKRTLDRLEAQAQQQPIELPVDADVDPALQELKRLEAEAERAAQSIASIEAAGAKAQKVGTILSVGVTAPLVLLGKQAVSTAADLESALSQTIGLAGGTAEQVAQAQDVIKRLAGETGKSLDDLSAATLAIFSAGFAGQQAFDILEVSAKAAAAGLGDTREVANAVTNAVSAYGPAVLTAASATDILVNTVKEGKAEASDLAPQFGRLLPVASELGISFEDVGAGLAFLTRSSGDAALSATQLGGIFNKLLKPSQQGAEALQDVGLSTQDLRDSLSEKGLLSTLVDVRKELEANGHQLTEVFEDAEGLTGVLALTADQGDRARQVFDHLGDSTGQLDSAFAAFDETDSAKLAKASANFQVALADFGQVALPIVAEALGLFSDAVELFDKLPAPLQQATVFAVGLAAALGPVLVIGGSIAKNLGSIISLSKTAADKLASIGTGSKLAGVAGQLGQVAGALGILAAGAAVSFGIIQQRLQENEGDTEKFLQGVVGSVNEAISSGDFDTLAAKFTAVADARNELAADANAAVAPFKKRQLTEAVIGLDSILASMDEVGTKAGELSQELGITKDQALQLAVGGDAAVEAFKRQSEAVGATIDPLVAANRAMEELQLAYLRGTDTSQQFNDVMALTGLSAEDLAAQLSKGAEAALKLGDQFVQGLGGIQQAFQATFSGEATATVDSFLNNFAKQTTEAFNFTLNLQKLVARGATDLAASFAAQGVSAAGLAAEAAASSDKDLAAFETRLDFIQGAQSAAEERQRNFAIRLKDGTLDLINDLPDGSQVTQRLTDALAQGDDAFFAELDRIAQEARDRAATGLDSAGQAGGAALVAGVGVGAETELERTKAKIQGVVDTILGIFTGPKGFDTGSPSKVTMRIGQDVAEGFNIGLDQGLASTDLSGLIPSTGQLQGALTAAPSFGPSSAVSSPGVQPGVGTQVTFTGDIVVPVPQGASPDEQADAIGRQVAFRLWGAQP